MSDRERERSRSRNGSREVAPPKLAKVSRRESRSRSRTPPPPKAHKKSRSRSGSVRRGYRARYSRSRSRSYSPRGSYRRSHSHSPMSSRRRHQGDRPHNGSGAPDDRKVPYYNNRAHLEKIRERQALMENPQQSRCLGVFGLSLYTTEQQINHIFSKFGPVERVQVVIDAKTGRSRGFCFVYMQSMDDAKLAKNECSGMEIDGRRIRVDFSITQRAHTPTPGIYMGRPTYRDRDNGYERGGRRGEREEYYGGRGGSYRERERDYYHRSSYRRSPSPQHYRGRSRRYERERSYSPRRY